MDKIFFKDGQDWIQWKAEDGNIWTAGLEEVMVFGKECFEQFPEPEDYVGAWDVTFDERYIDLQPLEER